MNNTFSLTALLKHSGSLRYTPAGIPVLDVTLQHESWQLENGSRCLVRFELPGKILGKDALAWQHRDNIMVEAAGFLAPRSQRHPRPILRIQNIQEYKG